MAKTKFFQRLIARLGRGLGLIFVMIGVPVIIIGFMLFLIPFIGWIFAIPLLVTGLILTFIGITIAARTAISKHHIHIHHSNRDSSSQTQEEEKESGNELEVKGNLVCYKCGTYITEKDKICKSCGAKQ